MYVSIDGLGSEVGYVHFHNWEREMYVITDGLGSEVGCAHCYEKREIS